MHLSHMPAIFIGRQPKLGWECSRHLFSKINTKFRLVLFYSLSASPPNKGSSGGGGVAERALLTPEVNGSKPLNISKMNT